MNHDRAVKMLAALGQDTRAHIYKLLICEEEGLSAGIISEKLAVPAATLSFHLSMMVNAGLLKSERTGRVITFFAKKKAIENLKSYLCGS